MQKKNHIDKSGKTKRDISLVLSVYKAIKVNLGISRHATLRLYNLFQMQKVLCVFFKVSNT